MDRRKFLVVGGLGAAGAGMALLAPRLDRLTRLAERSEAGTSTDAVTRYGPLRPPDEHGLALPAGFRARVIATAGEPVAGTGYVWPPAPDGAATFPLDGGGWRYVVNSEVDDHRGGASALDLAADGTVVAARRILGGTSRNCAGGATPWGTWLSCEEVDDGRVYECDPSGVRSPKALGALGTFAHEAAAVDADRGVVYLTEDRPDGCLYRFTPDRWPDLAAGRLDVARVADDRLTWLPVPDPSAGITPTRHQVPSSTPFDGGEGAWCADGRLWFTTCGDDRLWEVDLTVEPHRIRVVYDRSTSSNPVLGGVDNVVRSALGDLFIAEDGDDLELICLDATDRLAPFLRLHGHDGSELTGPCFSPDGRRLYLSSQRGAGGRGAGTTYEITGPFA